MPQKSIQNWQFLAMKWLLVLDNAAVCQICTRDTIFPTLSGKHYNTILDSQIVAKLSNLHLPANPKIYGHYAGVYCPCLNEFVTEKHKGKDIVLKFLNPTSAYTDTFVSGCPILYRAWRQQIAHALQAFRIAKNVVLNKIKGRQL